MVIVNFVHKMVLMFVMIIKYMNVFTVTLWIQNLVLVLIVQHSVKNVWILFHVWFVILTISWTMKLVLVNNVMIIVMDVTKLQNHVIIVTKTWSKWCGLNILEMLLLIFLKVMMVDVNSDVLILLLKVIVICVLMVLPLMKTVYVCNVLLNVNNVKRLMKNFSVWPVMKVGD